MQPMIMKPPTVGPQSLESRLALVESALKQVNNTITLQVGQSKIVISQNTVEISCPGTITIKALKIELNSQTDTNIKAGANIELRADSNISEKASGSLSIQASGALTLKGATITQN